MISACGGGSFSLRPASQFHPSFTARPLPGASYFKFQAKAANIQLLPVLTEHWHYEH
jgi:hypothetical protein